MTTSTKRLHKGFTLIELLTVIAIIGILAAIIIPTVGKVRETARRSVDSSNLRQVGQASLIFASDNRDLLPSTVCKFDTTGFTNSGGSNPPLKTIIGGLAASGGLNDAQIWFTGSESQNAVGLSTVLNSSRTGLETNFGSVSATLISFNYVAGLNTSDPSTTPVAFTRGLASNASTWATGTPGSPYNGDGGHIVFLGGNVAFYRNTSSAFISSNGSQTTNMGDARPRTTVSFITQ